MCNNRCHTFTGFILVLSVSKVLLVLWYMQVGCHAMLADLEDQVTLSRSESVSHGVASTKTIVAIGTNICKCHVCATYSQNSIFGTALGARILPRLSRCPVRRGLFAVVRAFRRLEAQSAYQRKPHIQAMTCVVEFCRVSTVADLARAPLSAMNHS